MVAMLKCSPAISSIFSDSPSFVLLQFYWAETRGKGGLLMDKNQVCKLVQSIDVRN